MLQSVKCLTLTSVGDRQEKYEGCFAEHAIVVNTMKCLL